MNLAIFLVLFVILLIVLMFIVALRVLFTLNSERGDIHLTLLWLYPFVKADITNGNKGLLLNIYLFNKRIITRPIGKQKTGQADRGKVSRLELLRQVKSRDVNVHAAFGFKDPFITGVACGAINMVSQFINIDSFDQEPDFIADKDYIYLDATAKVNLGSTLLNLWRVRGAGAH